MMKRPCVTFTFIAGFDQRYDALAGNTTGTDHQLHPVGSPCIGEETGIRCRGVLQFSVAGIRFRGEGPGKRQWFQR